MSDPRFARLKSDPRFRRPKTKTNKVVIDDRFKSVFAKDKTKAGRKVDKYGRPVAKTEAQDNLRRYYRLEGEDEEATAADEAEDKSGDDAEGPHVPDLARGEVLVGVHPHVERRVVRVREAALARVDLHRAHPEVQVDQVGLQALIFQLLQAGGEVGAQEAGLARDLGGELWGSIGRVPGFGADLWHIPSRDITVAVLTNDERIDPTEIADALLSKTIHQR